MPFGEIGGMHMQAFGEFDDIVIKPKRRNDPRKNHMRRRKEFIAWDGEGTRVDEPISMDGTGFYYWPDDKGRAKEILTHWERQPQPYVLLANSKDQRIVDRDGLSSYECLEFILNTKVQYPDSIFVGFGFGYDCNQIIKDLPEEYLWKLHNENHVYYGSYSIRWLPHKSFYVRHGRSNRSAIIYDVFGFFGTSFLHTCEEYLGKDDPELDLIKKGKAARSTFSFDELDEFIIPYNKMELSMLVRVMNILRDDLEQVSIQPSKWHGPGAVANEALALYNVPIAPTPTEVSDAAQYAYAGGRFEQYRMGHYHGDVFEYDIHSAYPAGATQLPDISCGSWEHVETYEHDTFGVWRVEYSSPYGNTDNRPQPLFCRAEDGSISYPRQVQGWFWSPEASLVAPYVTEGWVFRPWNTARPFAFVEAIYNQRQLFKEQGRSAQRALKLILNSLYGKLAQTVGGQDGPPRWHQLEYAGYITSYTRAIIYRAMMQNPDAIIAAETDAVFSTAPLDLPLSERLGEWELKKHHGIVYLQSGLYYADEGETCKYRGMDVDGETKQPAGLPYRNVLDHLATRTGFPDRPPLSLFSYTTRFIGLGLGLRTSSVWRTWERKAKQIRLDQEPWSSKRVHLAKSCLLCARSMDMNNNMHPLEIGGYSGRSYARALPWRSVSHETTLYDWDEVALEMDPTIRNFTADLDAWQ